MNRPQIAAETGMKNNTQLGTMLSELVECGMVYEYVPLGKRVNGAVYKLVDSLSLFHFRFLQKSPGSGDWLNIIKTPQYYSWYGLSYERVVLLHLDQVKKTLGISGMSVGAYCWFSSEKVNGGAQIDLLLGRADGIINIVEEKWAADGKEYVMTKDEEESLYNKRNLLVKESASKKRIHFTLVTVSGYICNSYSEMIQSGVTLDDLIDE